MDSNLAMATRNGSNKKPLLRHTFYSKGTIVIRQMGSPWAPHWHRYLLIFSWAIMKEFGSNNTTVLQFISTADICGWRLLPIQQRKRCFGIFPVHNDKHPNIRFTMETEVKQKLPFLDVLLDNSNPPRLVICLSQEQLHRPSHQLSQFCTFSLQIRVYTNAGRQDI